MERTNYPLVIGKQGLRGRLLTDASGHQPEHAPSIVQLDNGQQIRLPADVLVRQEDGSYYLPLSLGDLQQAGSQNGEQIQQAAQQNREQIQQAGPQTREHATRQETAIVVPVVQEEFSVDKRTVETGRGRFTRGVSEHSKIVDEPILRQDVQIDRVPINKAWEGPPPPPRYEADKLIIPLLEEVLVVEKRLMLKEELHISRVQKTVHEPQTVVLRSEDVTIERVEPAVEQQAGRT